MTAIAVTPADGRYTDVFAIDDIVVQDRHRKDLGDLSDLAASIATHGVLQPVVITGDGRLIAGERRLAALRTLGETHVVATVIDSIADAATLLGMERDENTCRKPMTPEELYYLGQALEEIERPKAVERRLEGNARGGLGEVGDPGNTDLGRARVREVVAAGLGIGGTTYDRIKAVVETATDPNQPQEVLEEANAALRQMNETGCVKPAAERVKEAKKTAARERITKQPRLRENPLLHKTRRIDSNRIVNETVGTLEGMVSGLALADPAALDPDRIEEWATSLRKSLHAMNRFLREMTR